MNEDRFSKAIMEFDKVNANDPNLIDVNDKKTPSELAYAIWLSEWVIKLNPNASEELRLAARCQHIKRWEIPRINYPEGLKGYTKWKKDLAEFHAEQAAKILTEIGYDSSTIERVKSIILKINLKTDREVQAMEDALCLVTFQYQIEGFSAKHDAEKMMGIIQKTWAKMSERAKQEALKLKYSERSTIANKESHNLKKNRGVLPPRINSF